MLHGFAAAQDSPPHPQRTHFRRRRFDQRHRHIAAWVTPDITRHTAAVAAICQIEDQNRQRVKAIAREIEEMSEAHYALSMRGKTRPRKRLHAL
ncbi:hypothetical protein QM565_39400 [Geitlerinema splendidum]|nr:hypothetical protein [Geitlerinema splendidum]